MTVTAQDIVNGAAQKLGILRKSESLSADESADAFTLLNDLLGDLSNESLMLYATVTDSLSLSAASSYLIGTGQTLSTERPMWIKAATITVGSIDYPLKVIPEDDFQVQIMQKTVSASIPQYLTYNNAFPYGTIKLWPVLSAAATLTLQSEKQLTAFTALSTTFSMPPGWSSMLKNNLALLMYPSYGISVDPSVVQEARTTKGNVKKQAIKAHPMTFSDDISTRYSVLSGTE